MTRFGRYTWGVGTGRFRDQVNGLLKSAASRL